MKKGHTYEIDYTTRTITVTRAFAEEASQMDNDAFDLMQKLIALGMNSQVKTSW